MKNLWFYKWYGVFIALILQGAFFYLYYKLKIYEQDLIWMIGYILVYQGIFIAALLNYSLLYKSYKRFIEMKEKEKEED